MKAFLQFTMTLLFLMNLWLLYWVASAPFPFYSYKILYFVPETETIETYHIEDSTETYDYSLLTLKSITDIARFIPESGTIEVTADRGRGYKILDIEPKEVGLTFGWRVFLFLLIIFSIYILLWAFFENLTI